MQLFAHLQFNMGLMAKFIPGFKVPDMSPFYLVHQFTSRLTGVGFQQVGDHRSSSLAHIPGASRIEIQQQKDCRGRIIMSMSAQDDMGKDGDCQMCVLGCWVCLYHSHLLWLAMQAMADIFEHRVESSADVIASAQFGQGGLMEMPFKRAGVAYETAREVGAAGCRYLTLCCRHPTGTCIGPPSK